MFPVGRFLARALVLGSRSPSRYYAEAAAAATGPAQLAFTFASPAQIFYNAAIVKQVDVPTLSGSFGILAAHVPTLQVLRPGVVTVFDEDGSSKKYFVSSGSLTVNADSSVQLLAEEVALLDELDAAAFHDPKNGPKHYVASCREQQKQPEALYEQQKRAEALHEQQKRPKALYEQQKQPKAPCSVLP